MPTKHPRIPVTADAALAGALARVAPYLGALPAARIVHDLAIRGAAAVVADAERRQRALERLADISTGEAPLLDLAVLDRVDELAWGAPGA